MAMESKINRHLNRIREDGAHQSILQIAAINQDCMLSAIKTVVHWERLGNPEMYPYYEKLLLDLMELGKKNPKLIDGQTVGGTVVRTLNGLKFKEEPAMPGEIEMRQTRVKTSEMFLHAVIKRGWGIEIVGPLISAATRDCDSREAALRLLAAMENNPIGNGSQKNVQTAMAACTGCVSNPQGRGIILQYALSIMRKFIAENDENLIYAVAPIGAVTQNELFRNETLELFEMLAMKKGFGTGDAECLKSIGAVANGIVVRDSAGERGERDRRMRYLMVRHILPKVIAENDGMLIHIVGPLMSAAREERCRDVALGLIKLTYGRKLGVGDAETMTNFVNVLSHALSDPKREKAANRIIRKLAEEGTVLNVRPAKIDYPHGARNDFGLSMGVLQMRREGGRTRRIS
jgi:hypothetical protein